MTHNILIDTYCYGNHCLHFQPRRCCPHTLQPTARCVNIFSLKAEALKYYESSVPASRAKSMTNSPYTRKWSLCVTPKLRCSLVPLQRVWKPSLLKMDLVYHSETLVPNDKTICNSKALVPTCQTARLWCQKYLICRRLKVITPAPCKSPTSLQESVKIILNRKYGGSFLVLYVHCTSSMQHPLHANFTTN